MVIVHGYLSFYSTRTCYRTCFEDGVCKSFVTGVNEQPLKIDIQHDSFTVQRIFSPRYNRSDYRKSTNCRYTFSLCMCIVIELHLNCYMIVFTWDNLTNNCSESGVVLIQ